MSRGRSVPSHFDTVAGDYDDTIPQHVRDHYLVQRVELFNRVLPAGCTVLEFGCGTGLIAACLQADGYVVTGIDLSHGMLARALKRCRGGMLVADATRVPFAEETFEATLCVALLHHIADRQLVASALREMVRVLRPLGLGIVIDHNPLNPYWRVVMRRMPQDMGDERLVPLREIVDTLIASGASCVDWHRSGFTPDFIPEKLLPVWSRVERVFNRLPAIRHMGAHNIVVFQKNS